MDANPYHDDSITIDENFSPMMKSNNNEYNQHYMAETFLGKKVPLNTFYDKLHYLFEVPGNKY